MDRLSDAVGVEIISTENYIDVVLDSMISGVVVIDSKDHFIVNVNDTAAHMIGLLKEDIIGNVCHKFICPAEVGHCPVSHPGQVIDRSERILLNYKGESVPILKSVKKVEKDGHIYLIESFIDMSELKEAKEDILIKKKAIDSSINAIAMADLEGCLTYVNSSFLELWGYDDENEVLERNGAKFWQYKNDPMDVSKTLMSKGSWSGESIAMKKDGTEFRAYLASHVIEDDVGDPVCLMASFVDITNNSNKIDLPME